MRVLATTSADLMWIRQRTGCGLTPAAKGIKAVDASGRIRGLVAYDGWTPNSMQAHMAVDSPIVWRSLLVPSFSYPFEECGKGLLLGIIAADNPRSLAMVVALGFRETYRVRDGWSAGVDTVLFEMRREECRWVAQQKREAA